MAVPAGYRQLTNGNLRHGKKILALPVRRHYLRPKPFDSMPSDATIVSAPHPVRSRMRRFGARLSGFFFLAAGIALASAQQTPKDAQADYDPRTSPGAGQKFLQKMVGDWDVEKIFHPRNGKPVHSKGECHQAMINDGRFLKSDFVFYGDTNTTGLGLVGFDPATGFFTSIWADSRSAKLSIRQSQEPFDGTNIVMSSVALAGGTREARPSRNRTHLEDNGRKIVHDQYATDTNNTERLMMELILTKKGE
jgi:Protein of unknown function (DUF1579)